MSDLTCATVCSAAPHRVPTGAGIVTEVRIEQASLDRGVVMVFARYGGLLLMAYDPCDITELDALALLRERAS